jgi:putative transposase
MSTVCRVLGAARSHVHVRAHRAVGWTDRRKNRRPGADHLLQAELHSVLMPLASYGYRRATTLINRQRRQQARPSVNHKRVYRLLRQAGWLLARHSGRPLDTRAHTGRIAVDVSNRRWCSDGFEIGCHNAERVRVAFALDCCDREAMSWVATTAGIDSDLVCDLMVESVEARFGDAIPDTPIEWLSDNGSPFVAHHTRSFANQLNLVPCTTAINSPQSNGMAESFVKTFKRDYVPQMDRRDAITVMQQLPAAFEHYNSVHPHSALKMLSPKMFRQQQSQLSISPCPEK